MQVISLETCKTLLGISDSAYDTAISAAIPYIDAVVKKITGNRYNYKIKADIENGSQYAFVYTDTTESRYGHEYDNLKDFLQVGLTISGTGIPDNTYISDLYYNSPTVKITSTDESIPQIILSQAATQTATSKELFIGINILYRPIIAKAIWWHTLQLNTTIQDTAWKSKRMGPVSITKTDMDARLDGKYGLPVWFVRAFPKGHTGY